MPKYCYSCKECDFLFKTHHGINEILKNCSQCGAVDALVRQVNKVFITNTKTAIILTDKKNKIFLIKVLILVLITS